MKLLLWFFPKKKTFIENFWDWDSFASTDSALLPRNMQTALSWRLPGSVWEAPLGLAGKAGCLPPLGPRAESQEVLQVQAGEAGNSSHPPKSKRKVCGGESYPHSSIRCMWLQGRSGFFKT